MHEAMADAHAREALPVGFVGMNDFEAVGADNGAQAAQAGRLVLDCAPAIRGCEMGDLDSKNHRQDQVGKKSLARPGRRRGRIHCMSGTRLRLYLNRSRPGQSWE
jgi:hypothetical protein